MNTKQKYVRVGEYDSFIIFPVIIEHSEFKHLKPISAGFCNIYNNKVSCYGKSFSLGISSCLEDTELATKQIFGIEAMLNLL